MQNFFCSTVASYYKPCTNNILYVNCTQGFDIESDIICLSIISKWGSLRIVIFFTDTMSQINLKLTLLSSQSVNQLKYTIHIYVMFLLKMLLSSLWLSDLIWFHASKGICIESHYFTDWWSIITMIFVHSLWPTFKMLILEVSADVQTTNFSEPNQFLQRLSYACEPNTLNHLSTCTSLIVRLTWKNPRLTYLCSKPQESMLRLHRPYAYAWDEGRMIRYFVHGTICDQAACFGSSLSTYNGLCQFEMVLLYGLFTVQRTPVSMRRCISEIVESMS